MHAVTSIFILTGIWGYFRIGDISFIVKREKKKEDLGGKLGENVGGKLLIEMACLN